MNQPCKSKLGICIACPQEVRNLYATAFNLINLCKQVEADPERVKRKLPERMAELKAAVDKLTPIVEAHFGDT